MSKQSAEARIVRTTVPFVPGDFLNHASDPGSTSNVVNAYFSWKGLPDLTDLGSTGLNVLVPCPDVIKNALPVHPDSHLSAFDPTRYSILNGSKPAFLARQFGRAIGAGKMAELFSRWEKVKTAIWSVGEGSGRSGFTTACVQFGIRTESDGTLSTSFDARGWSREASYAIQAFLKYIRTFIVAIITRYTRNYDPEQWYKQERLRDFLRNKTGLFTQHPYLDFSGAFTTVTVSEGVDEKFRVEDSHGGITWVVPLGTEWSGGMLQLPQLGYRIPLRPYDVLGFQGRFMAHSYTPITSGKRITLTLSTCRNTLISALQD